MKFLSGLLEQLDSKKFRGLLTGLVMTILVGTGVVPMVEGLEPLIASIVGGLTGLYMLSQGMADAGKEKAKIELEAKKPA